MKCKEIRQSAGLMSLSYRVRSSFGCCNPFTECQIHATNIIWTVIMAIPATNPSVLLSSTNEIAKTVTRAISSMQYVQVAILRLPARY